MNGDGLSVRPLEPLSRHTAYRTGGRCDVWVVAHRLDGLVRVFADCRAVGWKVTVVGAGTRTVVRDGPVPGAVVRLGTDFAGLGRTGSSWEVGAAVPVPAVVAAAAGAGMGGLEGLACAPGSVGASVLLDDGWSEVVESVSVLRRNGAADVGLDEARKKKPVVLSVRLRLAEGTPAEVLRRTREAWRRLRPQPPSSWYESPRRGSLRKVLGAVRLDEVRLREVAIPESAPELLVNLGGGTAADLALLHRSVVERVSKVRGEDLVSRARWIGTASSGRPEEEERWWSAGAGSES